MSTLKEKFLNFLHLGEKSKELALVATPEEIEAQRIQKEKQDEINKINHDIAFSIKLENKEQLQILKDNHIILSQENLKTLVFKKIHLLNSIDIQTNFEHHKPYIKETITANLDYIAKSSLSICDHWYNSNQPLDDRQYPGTFSMGAINNIINHARQGRTVCMRLSIISKLLPLIKDDDFFTPSETKKYFEDFQYLKNDVEKNFDLKYAHLKLGNSNTYRDIQAGYRIINDFYKKNVVDKFEQNIKKLAPV